MTVESYMTLFDCANDHTRGYRITNDNLNPNYFQDLYSGSNNNPGLLITMDESVSDEQLLAFLRKCEFLDDPLENLTYSQIASLFRGRPEVAGWRIKEIDVSYGRVGFDLENPTLYEISHAVRYATQEEVGTEHINCYSNTMWWYPGNDPSLDPEIKFTVRTPKRSGKYPKHRYTMIIAGYNKDVMVSEVKRNSIRELLFIEETEEHKCTNKYPVLVAEARM